MIRTNPVSPILISLVYELVYSMNKRFYLFLRLVLRESNAYGHFDFLTKRSEIGNPYLRFAGDPAVLCTWDNIQ